MGTHSGRRAGAALGIRNARVGTLLQLLKQEGAFQAHALDGATRALDTRREQVVRALYLADAFLDVPAFLPIRLFDRRWERWKRARHHGGLGCFHRIRCHQHTERGVGGCGGGCSGRRVAGGSGEVYVCALSA